MRGLINILMRALFGKTNHNHDHPSYDSTSHASEPMPPGVPMPVPVPVRPHEKAAVERKARQQEEALQRYKDTIEVVTRQQRRPGPESGMRR